MIDIFIDDDNKVTIKTSNGLAETEIATAAVLKAMRDLKKPEQDVESKLVLVSYDTEHKLLAIKEIKIKLGLGLEEAKGLVDDCVDRKIVVLSEGPKSRMNVLFNRFDSSVVQVKVIDDKEWL